MFDYIIVHGIYSWVPDNVKDKILEICRENLTSNGIAYISYNTYPGWKSREVARDIMLYANKYTQDLPLAEQTRRGKVVVQLFSDAIKSIASEKIKNHSRVDNLVVFKHIVIIILHTNILHTTIIQFIFINLWIVSININ